jgi:Holliday junction DNA helicase RuvA
MNSSFALTFLHGKLVEALPTQAVIDVNGVGYDVLIPLSSFDKLPPPGRDVKLLTQLIVREDAHVLYGFASATERDLFRLLINSVSGIGPKTALNILSGMNAVAFRGAVAGGDVSAFANFRRRQAAERIVVELRDKVSAGTWEASSAQRPSPADQRSMTPCSRWRSASNKRTRMIRCGRPSRLARRPRPRNSCALFGAHDGGRTEVRVRTPSGDATGHNGDGTRAGVVIP